MKIMRLLVLVLALALVATSCAKAPPEEAPPTERTWDRILISGSVMGGSGYSISVGMTQVTNKALPKIAFTIEETTGYADNAKRIVAGVSDMAMTDSLQIYRAVEGLAGYEEREIDLVVLMRLRPNLYVLLQATGDKQGWTLRDLEGKPASLQLEGTGSYAVIKPALDAIGVKVIEKNMKHSDAGDALLEGTIVGHAGTGGYIPVLELVAARKGMWLIGPAPEDIPIILDACPWFSLMTFYGSKYYKGCNDLDSMGVQCCWVSRSDLPDDIAYTLVKAAYENIDTLGAAYSPLKEIEPSDILGLTVENSIHPGVVKYYKEMGIDIPEKYIYKR